MQQDVFTPRVVSRPSASSRIDCLSEFGQLKDGSWFLPLSSDVGTTITDGITTFSACVALCNTTSCQLATYDYRAGCCMTRLAQPAVMEGRGCKLAGLLCVRFRPLVWR